MEVFFFVCFCLFWRSSSRVGLVVVVVSSFLLRGSVVWCSSAVATKGRVVIFVFLTFRPFDCSSFLLLQSFLFVVLFVPFSFSWFLGFVGGGAVKEIL